MGKFIRFINQGIKHFFIIDGEYLSDGCNEFKNRLPDSFTDSQLVAVKSQMNLVLDGSADHLNGEVNLAHRILIKTPLYGSVLIPFRGVSSGEFLLTHAVITLPAFSPRMAKSTSIWLIPSVMPRKRALKPRMLRCSR